MDFFTLKIASSYVSRMVTKVFLGHFEFIEDIFNDFGVPNMIFVAILRL